MDDPKHAPDAQSNEELSGCACVQDPFAALPPELRPKPESQMRGLRKVTCRGCGKTYWTNKSGDLCASCQKAGVKLPHTEAAQEE